MERRQRILDATLSLVREHGLDDLSVVQIAARAKVGVATVYNLFETKHVIFSTILDRELQEFSDRMSRKGAISALEKIFLTVEFVVEIVERDPQFYRAMAYASSEEKLAAAVTKRRVATYVEMISCAISEGQLRRDTEPDDLGVTLANLISGTALGSVLDVSKKRLAARLNYGVALVLHAFSTESGAPLIRRYIEAARAVLRAAPGRHPRAHR